MIEGQTKCWITTVYSLYDFFRYTYIITNMTNGYYCIIFWRSKKLNNDFITELSLRKVCKLLCLMYIVLFSFKINWFLILKSDQYIDES